jgi:hypothetical protein
MPSFVNEANAGALKEKVEAYAEGIIGSGWLWVRFFLDLLHLPSFLPLTVMIISMS